MNNTRREPSSEPVPMEFADRVMAAIDLEPVPTPTRTFVQATRIRAWRDASAAVAVAWHLGTVRTWRVAPSARARSLALVFAVAALVGMATLVGATAAGVVAEPIARMVQLSILEQGQPPAAGQPGKEPPAAQSGDESGDGTSPRSSQPDANDGDRPTDDDEGVDDDADGHGDDDADDSDESDDGDNDADESDDEHADDSDSPDGDNEPDESDDAEDADDLESDGDGAEPGDDGSDDGAGGDDVSDAEDDASDD